MSSIDPDTAISLAILKTEFSHMKTTIDDLKFSNARQTEKLDLMLQAMHEAKGGWRTLLMMGGAAGTIGGLVTWAISHWRG